MDVVVTGVVDSDLRHNVEYFSDVLALDDPEAAFFFEGKVNCFDEVTRW